MKKMNSEEFKETWERTKERNAKKREAVCEVITTLEKYNFTVRETRAILRIAEDCVESTALDKNFPFVFDEGTKREIKEKIKDKWAL